MAYDRDEFVRLLTDYYNFCNRAFWNATVTQAPSVGCTSINQETLAPLKRNSTVFDLLRHMPYIDSPGNSVVLAPFIMEYTPITDYRSEDLQNKIREDYIEGLVAATTGQDPPLPSCAHDEPASALNSTLERFRGDPANGWRLAGFNVHEPAELFALCKERYRELSWIGLGPSHMSVMRRNMNWEYESEPGSDSDREDGFSHNKIARKIKKAGWPGD
ncbi:hypothetical protein K4K48_012593 [Colletotrichum sp. SAR 10_66]|nr:hypothetical protein K4K51_002555 [Colletotrichum sp. SAR 10_75]KAJ5003054.1 hypothetical protein K4K48_012593 [Colletotrichum sp. SAR 10_66]